MSIYKNGIDSIKVGVEDMQSNEAGRVISGLRNIHAGILLLIKAKLSSLSGEGSDEVLIKQKILPTKDKDGNVCFTGQGRKTVDIFQMKERCESLNVSINWKPIDKITKLRNDSEHYFTTVPPKTIQEALAKTFIVISDLLRNHLGKTPQEELGEEIWQFLLESEEVYDQERDECVSAIEMVDWESAMLEEAVKEHSCDVCGSNLLKPTETNVSFHETNLKCGSCGNVFSFHEYASVALNKLHEPVAYLAMTDGGDPEIVDCPFCGEFGYVIEEGRCALCEEYAHRQCARCSNPIPVSELSDGSLCGYCQHMSDRDT
ncbi:hypothetical protein IEN85_19275 [Pelagicoccus sp. NFK12]|uniref:Uncharacterized protein n=1 Tax=Pelagicoccus enzymogenes TaxID=2773457 RepID=A0A927IIV4_9BACT|nr:hypothetical protein [Pelagicoccus enzymogenes]MBD5781651.1 hypothetical protein [Pelagicoccus enzymogenes]